jgi:hypothetical protein
MDAVGARQCTPTLSDKDRGMAPRPYIMDFSSGYIQRVLEKLPKQGDHAPWANPQNYTRDRKMFRESPIDDGVLVFSDDARRECA